ncbi:hypothetical protein SKA53_11103 [Yoonia vestfoldensis SKA53]|uniref:Uncharacterized protein n=1 Tax=Yoonia vestfoldensis SKA53 TaxID=314232 RepID=A3V1Z5_9RHOB|nr:hypothetical protein SKA53_11103 [Yoonia vestfoldensis SKA53]
MLNGTSIQNNNNTMAGVWSRRGMVRLATAQFSLDDAKLRNYVSFGMTGRIVIGGSIAQAMRFYLDKVEGIRPAK